VLQHVRKNEEIKFLVFLVEVRHVRHLESQIGLRLPEDFSFLYTFGRDVHSQDFSLWNLRGEKMGYGADSTADLEDSVSRQQSRILHLGQDTKVPGIDTGLLLLFRKLVVETDDLFFLLGFRRLHESLCRNRICRRSRSPG